MLHHDCQCPLEHRRSHKKDKYGNITNQSIYSVFYCSNNNCNITVNRDVNACQNILEILIYLINFKTRHPAFIRSRNLLDPFTLVDNCFNYLNSKEYLLSLDASRKKVNSSYHSNISLRTSDDVGKP
jgi:hypothetical protein